MPNSTLTTPQSTGHALFGYTNPSLPMAWIGGILFSISVIVHLIQYFKHRAWFMYLMLLGVCMEVAGYWTRVVAIKNPSNHAATSMTYLFSTLAPSLLAAGCYMTFGRIIYWVTPESHRGFRHTWVPTRFVAIFFIFWDFLSFFIQCVGIFFLIANLYKKNLTVDRQTKVLTTTYDILRVGFIMQTIGFGIFALTSIRFIFASKNWRYDWPEGGSSSWKRLAWTVTGSSMLITGRSLYRCLEFSLKRGNNYLRSHEWAFYLFDFLLILLVVIAFNITHPGAHLPHEYATAGGGYKKAGFRQPAVKVADADQPTAGYSRVSLVPPPLAPPNNNAPAMKQMNTSMNTSMNFSDPWNNRPSPGAERY